MLKQGFLVMKSSRNQTLKVTQLATSLTTPNNLMIYYFRIVAISGIVLARIFRNYFVASVI